MANIKIPLEIQRDEKGEIKYQVLDSLMNIDFETIHELPAVSNNSTNLSTFMDSIFDGIRAKEKLSENILDTHEKEEYVKEEDAKEEYVKEDEKEEEKEDEKEEENKEEKEERIIVVREREKERLRKSLNKTFKNIGKQIRNFTQKNYQ